MSTTKPMSKKRAVKRTTIASVLQHYKWINIFLFMVMIGMIVGYIAFISIPTRYGYEMSILESEYKTINDDIVLAEQTLHTLKSAGFIVEQAQLLDMEAVNEVDFLSALPSGVALVE